MIKVNKNYLALSIALFVTEILIALYVDDNFVRPYVGDYLVVILLYCMVKSFVNLDSFTTAVGVLIFSYVIEALQYVNFIQFIGLQNSKLANIVMGNYFTWVDIVAYSLGIATVVLIEKLRFQVSEIRLKA